MSYKFECLDYGHSERVIDPEYGQITCPKCGGRFVDLWELDKYKNKKPKLLTIELDSYDSDPKVFLNGAEIDKKVSVQFEYNTGDDKGKPISFFKSVYVEEVNDLLVLKTVAFEDPFRDA